VNASTTRTPATAAETRAEQRLCAPFAALPHDIAADPRLSPTDVRVLLALLFWARSKAVCWPSDRSIALRIGRSSGTVQRALRHLEALDLIERRRADNPTGRELVLRWRATPAAPVIDPPASRARDEGRREREEEWPSSAACYESTPPPAGETVDPQAPPSAEDLAQLTAWAQGPDPALARFGKAALKLAGVDPDAVAQTDPVPRAVHGDHPRACPVVPASDNNTLISPATGGRISPNGEKPPSSPSAQARSTRTTTAAKPSTPPPWSQGLPRSRNAQARRQAPSPDSSRRHDRGPRHVLDQLVGAAAVLTVRASPGCAAPV
jgi:hypothetical protein